jgi:glycerol uptake facilitator protein
MARSHAAKSDGASRKGEPATGGAVNPARAFGPDLVGALYGVGVSWSASLVAYLIGPILGAVAAANLSRYVTAEPERKPAPDGE